MYWLLLNKEDNCGSFFGQKTRTKQTQKFTGELSWNVHFSQVVLKEPEHMVFVLVCLPVMAAKSLMHAVQKVVHACQHNRVWFSAEPGELYCRLTSRRRIHIVLEKTNAFWIATNLVGYSARQRNYQVAVSPFLLQEIILATLDWGWQYPERLRNGLLIEIGWSELFVKPFDSNKRKSVDGILWCLGDQALAS